MKNILQVLYSETFLNHLWLQVIDVSFFLHNIGLYAIMSLEDGYFLKDASTMAFRIFFQVMLWWLCATLTPPGVTIKCAHKQAMTTVIMPAVFVIVPRITSNRTKLIDFLSCYLGLNHSLFFSEAMLCLKGDWRHHWFLPIRCQYHPCPSSPTPIPELWLLKMSPNIASVPGRQNIPTS